MNDAMLKAAVAQLLTKYPVQLVVDCKSLEDTNPVAYAKDSGNINFARVPGFPTPAHSTWFFPNEKDREDYIRYAKVTKGVKVRKNPLKTD